MKKFLLMLVFMVNTSYASVDSYFDSLSDSTITGLLSLQQACPDVVAEALWIGSELFWTDAELAEWLTSPKMVGACMEESERVSK